MTIQITPANNLGTLLGELNPSQRNAATFKNQHVLVLAGAGSGKTKTIIARAAYLIDSGVDPRRIRILTFTRKSSAEIVSRVELCLGDGAKGLVASTFHAWCMSLIRSAPDTFSARGYSVIDRDDQLQLFKVLRGKKKKSEIPAAKVLCDSYSFARNTGMPLDDVINLKIPEYEDARVVIRKIMDEYERKKVVNRYLDYDDILGIVAIKLHESDEVRKWLSSRYDHILIDEMQDTNWSQWRLITPLKNEVSLFAVGDDAQSIYGFRGADFTNIHNFTEHVPGANVLKLEENYRSTQEILDISNWLLSKSSFNYNKTLRAARGKGNKPQLYNFQDEWVEARWITADLKKRHEKGANWCDHMILVRSAFIGRTIETAMLESNVPYQYIGGAKFLESAHVRDLLSVLRIVANPRDEIAAMRYLTLWPGIGEVRATKFVEKMTKVQSADDLSGIFLENRDLPKEAIVAIDVVIKQQGNVVDALKGVYSQMESLLASKYQNQEWENRKKDLPLIFKLAEKHNTISEFIEDYLLDPLTVTQVEQGEQDDVATIITIHSAKGAEAQICYVVNVFQGSYPGHFSTTEDSIEEERRVLYVALTRAKNELIITRRELICREYLKGVGEYYFLNDLPNDLADEIVDQSYLDSIVKIRKKTPSRKDNLKFGLRF